MSTLILLTINAHDVSDCDDEDHGGDAAMGEVAKGLDTSPLYF